jgi:hypothetical protein
MGIVLQWGRQPAKPRATLAPLPVRTLWRTCQICGENEALVYCRAHSVYSCLECLQAHEIMEGVKVPQECDGYMILASTWDQGNKCEYISRSVAAAMLR